MPDLSMQADAVKEANDVESAFAGRWIGVEPLVRARGILEHAGRDPKNGWKLSNAMQHMPYWSQGPSNYLDMVRALTAAGVDL